MSVSNASIMKVKDRRESLLKRRNTDEEKRGIAMATNPQSNDEPVKKGDNEGGLSVIQAIQEYKIEAETARKDRMQMNKRNRDAARNVQDWSHKEEGQSTEFIPKTSSALETFSSFIKRALTQFGDWFSVVSPDEAPLDGKEIRAILLEFLTALPVSLFNREKTTVQHVLSDGVKVGLTEATIVMKVHGYKTKKPQFDFEKGENSFKLTPWNLAIDLIPNENYLRDPTGRKLYEIHRCERDLADLVRLAEQGVYDKEVVSRLTDATRNELEAKDRKDEQKQDKTPPPSFRTRVVVDEFWGTIIDKQGNVLHENVTCTVANDTYLIRKPIPNPFWHGESPFVTGPLTRVPFSEMHRALFDNATPLNEAMNEMFNLMLDGGISSVWGINQLRPEYLEDPRQVSDGISQGTTLVMNDSAPEGAKVFEQVSTGSVPGEALAMYNLLDKEFNAAALTNDIKMGLLPTKEVKACVPLDSEILTKKGWKTYDQLELHEEILGFNTETGLCEWTPLNHIYVYEDAEVYEYRHRSFRVLCTEDHKWVQKPRWDKYNKDPKGWDLLPFGEGPRQSTMLQSAPAPDGEGVGKLHPQKLLDRPDLPNMVMKMTSAERQAFIVGSMASDGTCHKKPNGSQQSSFSQNPGPVMDAFRLACQLEGISTNEYNPHLNAPGRKYTKCHRASILSTNERAIDRISKAYHSNQAVWCPSVKLKTWVMRQGMTITITGNTEIVEASQSQAATLDAIVSDYEFYIEQLLKKAWITICQNADDIDVKMIDNAVGRKAAVKLALTEPEELFKAYADTAMFKVFGLSATLARAQDFQKLMAVIAAIKDNPLLMQKFNEKYSEDKIINQMMKMMNLNTEMLERDEEEQAQRAQQMQEAQAMQEAGLAGSGGPVRQQGGMAASVNQEMQPTGGL